MHRFIIRLNLRASVLGGLLTALVSVLPVFAQISDVPPGVYDTLHPVSDSGHRIVHLPADFCGTDLTSPDARASLKAFRNRQDAAPTGLRLAFRSGADPDIGDRREFNVLQNVSDPQSWAPATFELRDKTDVYYLWVEVDELANGNVTDAELAELRSIMLERTPSASIDPGSGILDNSHAIWGDPPNVDGDGRVDMLMYDIGQGSGNTLGYVASQDLNLDSEEGVGNKRDVLYLDSAEGTRNLNWMAAVAAHEYTHLIHARYGWDETLVTEGYAEYSMVMNGYFVRHIDYPSISSEVVLPLFTWREGGGPNTRDYQRGGLLFTYIADETSPQIVGRMLRGLEEKGGAGMDSVLTSFAGSSLKDILLGFHSANLFNDRSIRPGFGYPQPQRSSFNAALSASPIDGEQQSTVGEGGYYTTLTENNRARPNPGSPKYFQWTDVADFLIDYDTPGYTFFPPSLQDRQRQLLYSRNRLRLVLEPADGGEIEVRDLEPSQSPTKIEGKFSSITAIFVHLDPDIAIPDAVSFEVTWTPASAYVTDTETGFEQPSQTTLAAAYPNPFNPVTTIQLRLERTGPVRVAVYDMLGREMDVLADRIMTAGEHRLRLRADNWPSGTYIVRLLSDGTVQSRTVTLLK